MNSNKFSYRYKFFKNISDFTSIFFALCLFVFGVMLFSVFILDGQIFWALIYFLGFVIWTPFFFLSMSFLYTDIQAETDGLLIYFAFKTLFVEWKDIKFIKPAKFLGMRTLPQCKIIVVKKGLTLFHKIYGLMYGQTQQPAFLIFTSISDYEKLISIIKNNTKKTKEKMNINHKKNKRNL